MGSKFVNFGELVSIKPKDKEDQIHQENIEFYTKVKEEDVKYKKKLDLME